MPSQHTAFPYPDGGMDEMYPSHLIGDNKFVNLENFYYNSGNKLVSRPGTEYVASFDSHIYGIGTMPNVGLAVAVQSGSVLYGRSTSLPGFPAFSSIKTGVATGDRYFATMNSAIYSGTTIGTATTDNLKWSPTAAAAVTWPGSPPALSFLCTWNARMWGVKRNSTLLYFSKVGDPDDFTTSGVSGAGFVDIGYSDAEMITGLVAHNEQLFILKERSIWHIVTGNPNTDTSLWRVEIVTHNYGCSNHKGIVVSGNDVLIPDAAGYVSLNAALYQGDFKISNVSQPMEYMAGGCACYVPMTGQHLYFFPSNIKRQISCLERFGQNIRWMNMSIHNASGTKLNPILCASGYQPPTIYGDFYAGPFIDGAYSLIVMARQTSSGAKFDLVQYPTTYQGSEGHYDYIDGPEGPYPIRKKFKTKMHTFGNLGFDKQSRNVVYAYTENDRPQLIDTDQFTLSAIFNGDDANNIQSKVVNDQGTAENGPENTIVTNMNRTGLRVAVMGLGGTEGRVFKGVQIQLENNIGGYELEYAGLEMDVDTATGKPTPTPQVLA